MRKILLSLSCILPLYAEQMYLYEISPIIGLTENGTDTGLERSVAYGLQLQYNDIDLLIKPELTYIYSPNINVYDEAKKANASLLLLNGVYDLEYTALLTPFLKAGVGYQSVSDLPGLNSNAFVVGTGAGLKLNIRDKLAIKFEAVVTWQDFSEHNLLVFGGLDFSFGNEDNTPAVAYTPPSEEQNGTVVDTNATADTMLVETPVFISKADLNLSEAPQTQQEIVATDAKQRITSLTLFVPYLFRGYELDESSKQILIKNANRLRNEDVSITVIGHTNAKGRRAYNEELSLKRAETVKAFLIDQGIDIARIHVEGHGEREPIADKNDPAAAQLNKRIEIKIKYNEPSQ